MNLTSLFDLKAAIISLVLAVALAIPAIGGTQADFTAVTTNPGNVFRSAVISMATDHPAGAFVDVSNLAPGDTVTRTVTVENTGAVPFTYAITATNEGGPETALWKNKVKGLQVSVSGDSGEIYAGPISHLAGISSGTVVPAGGTEVLTYVFSLPNATGNAFQGLAQGVGITYDATQLAGQAR